MVDRKDKTLSLVEATESLPSSEFATLVSEANYILDLTLVETIDQSCASFEGGDDWVFDEYAIRINEQILPVSGDAYWASNTLSMPGRKSTQYRAGHLETGEHYLAFYNYSAMARGYSLEGLMRRTDDRVDKIARLISK